MSPWLSLGISCLALLIAGITAWLTFFRKGKLVMTQPTVVFFGPDGSRFESGKNKIYLRTLLYSTAKRGQVLESLHVSLRRNESKQNFNIWVYDDKGKLKRGSGLFVPQEGVTSEHHFLLPEDGAHFEFLSGAYKLVVYAKLVGEAAPKELMAIDLAVSESQALRLSQPNTGFYHDWCPDQQSYHSHIEKKPEREPSLENFIEFLANNKMQPTQEPHG